MKKKKEDMNARHDNKVNMMRATTLNKNRMTAGSNFYGSRGPYREGDSSFMPPS